MIARLIKYFVSPHNTSLGIYGNNEIESVHLYLVGGGGGGGGGSEWGEPFWDTLYEGQKPKMKN